MIPIDWIFDMHLVGSFGPPIRRGEVEDEFGGPNHDAYFSFSTDRNAFAIDVAWFRASGDIIPWNKRWAGA